MFDTAPLGEIREWLRAQPDRPFVITFGHLIVILLYLTHHAVSPVPFTGEVTHSIVTSPVIPVVHAIALLGMILGLARQKTRGGAACVSLMTWSATTIVLYFLATQRNPPLALWAPGMSAVITLAAFLMFVRWGVDGVDDSEVT